MRYTAPHLGYNNEGLSYAPTDTRIIPVSNTLCQGLELTVTDNTPNYIASLFMLDSPPKLAGEVFSVTSFSHYNYFYYYLYPGSNFTVSACMNEDTGNQNGTFDLIKGNKYYEQWNQDGPHTSTYHTTINAQCADGRRDTFSYWIEKEDYYFFVLLSQYPYDSQVNSTLSFYRTLYEWSDYSNYCSESIESYGVSCSVSVPLSLQTAFLAIKPKDGSQVDWSVEQIGIGLNITCIPRIWMYVLISLAILTGLVAIFLPILVCIIVHLRKINKNAPHTTYTPIRCLRHV